MMTLLFNFTGKSENVNSGTYDYVDELKPSVGYNASTERLVINENLGDGRGVYHEAVLYHSAGPNTSSSESMKKAASDEHIYEEGVLYNSPKGEVPVYEDPSLSQVCKLKKKCKLYIIYYSLIHVAFSQFLQFLDYIRAPSNTKCLNNLCLMVVAHMFLQK